MKFSFSEPGLPKNGAVIVCVGDGSKLSATAKLLDKSTSGALSRAIKESRFTGKKAQFLDIMAPSDVAYGRIILAGIGKGLDDNDQQSLGGRLYARLNQAGIKTAHLAVEAMGLNLDFTAQNPGILLGLLVKAIDSPKTGT